MKTKVVKTLLAVVCFAVVSAPSGFAAYDERVVHVLEQLRSCKFGNSPMVGGQAIGDAGTPHEFYLLIPYVRQFARDADLRLMLKDKSPVVRIMAAKCILKRNDSELRLAVDGLLKDSAEVLVAPYGCGLVKETVGEVVAELKRNPNFLEERDASQLE